MFEDTRVSIGATFELICSGTNAEQIDVDLRYRADEPFAVSLAFWSGVGESTWLVSRDLLAHGLTGASGIGDVQLRPHTDDTLLLELGSEYSHMVFQVPADAMRAFLESTYDIVPR